MQFKNVILNDGLLGFQKLNKIYFSPYYQKRSFVFKCTANNSNHYKINNILYC